MISARSYRIGKKDGLIDKMAAGLNEDASPKAKRRAQLAFEKFDAHVRESRESGAKLEQKFEEWEQSAEQEVQNAKLKEDSLKDKEKEIQQSILQAESARKKAKEELGDIEKVPSSLAAGFVGLTIGLSVTAAMGVAEISAIGLLNGGAGLLAAAPAAAMTYLARYRQSKDIRTRVFDRTQENVNQLARELEDCRESVRKANESLRSAKTSAENWKDINEAAGTIASQISRLNNHVKATMGYFAELHTELKLFSDVYESGSRVTAENPEGENDGLEDLDFDDVEIEMKCHAHILHALSSAYAHIYGAYIQEGFRLVASFRYREDDEKDLSGEELRNRRQGKLKVYLREAKAGIKDKVYQEKLKLFREAQVLFPGLTDASELKPKRITDYESNASV
ncbi:uncharacterized protein DFL_007897 [Arthrobotrys flagrans]|uniref:Uncharacterized protein n=1 Tax=Arthrobotrys flagrans TaxID=97331 RepID=A0A436ZX21_ARTFL|nr:hypothetical protein DFL_007897 [Arthrobotrys flagrans]